MNKDYSFEVVRARNQVVKPAMFDTDEGEYICSHCGSKIPVDVIAYGYDCKECGLPFNER